MLLDQIVNGAANGFLYALLALGFATVYQSMRLINFAQGDLFMVGAFAGYVLGTQLALPVWIVLLVTTACLFSLGAAIEKLVLAPGAKEASGINIMIRTIGVSVFLQGLALIFFGTEEYRCRDFGGASVLFPGTLAIPVGKAVVGGASLAMMFLLGAFLKCTHLGLAMRAASQDRDGAEMIGIDVRQMRTLAYGISAALAGAAGVLIGPLWYVHHSMGIMMGLKGFTAAVLGGLGSLRGAATGGVLLGLVENLGAGYVSSTWKDAVVFCILLVTLAVKPSGFFHVGGRQRA
jgi:branched-chain amino acid transport system permease protein